ncbi:MAG: hypothetical protein ACOC8B_04685 [Gemmatimonadota bacterium]
MAGTVDVNEGAGGLGRLLGSGRGGEDRIAAVIVVAAVVLVAAAVLDIARGSGSARVEGLAVESASEGGARPAGAVPLYTLLPDLTDDLGRVVRLEGTVAAVDAGAGYWVVDMRGNVVYVGAAGAPAGSVARGDAVRVTGRVELVSDAAVDRGAEAVAAARDGSAGQLIRAVELAPIDGGLVRLEP